MLYSGISDIIGEARRLQFPNARSSLSVHSLHQATSFPSISKSITISNKLLVSLIDTSEERKLGYFINVTIYGVYFKLNLP